MRISTLLKTTAGVLALLLLLLVLRVVAALWPSEPEPLNPTHEENHHV